MSPGRGILPEDDSRPDLDRGDRVVVHEQGIRDREGEVLSVKWSFATGWWVEVRYEDGIVWSIPAAFVVKAS